MKYLVPFSAQALQGSREDGRDAGASGEDMGD